MRTYLFVNWDLAHQGAEQIVYRPGLKTLMGRLGLTLIMAVLIATLYFGIADPLLKSSERRVITPATQQQVEELARATKELEESLRETMTEEAWQDYVRKREAEQTEREAQIAEKMAQQNAVVQTGIAIVGGVCTLFALVGLLAPLSVLWNRLSIDRDIRGNLTVSTRVLWPRTHSWPMDSFGRITVCAKEVIHSTRYRRNVSVGWRWHVFLEAKGAGLGTQEPVAFCPSQQKSRPSLEGRMPDRVAIFVQWLESMTRLPVSGPTIMEFSGMEPGLFSTKRRFRSVGQPHVERHTYRSLDEMPPEVCAQAERMMAEGKTTHSTHSITVRDAEGREQTYNSLDEMPPELRAKIEEIRRRHGTTGRHPEQ